MDLYSDMVIFAFIWVVVRCFCFGGIVIPFFSFCLSWGIYGIKNRFMLFGAYICRCTHVFVYFGSSIHKPMCASSWLFFVIHALSSPLGSAMSTAAPYRCELPMALGLIRCWSLIDRKQLVAYIGGWYPNAFIFRHRSSMLRSVTVSTSDLSHLCVPAFNNSSTVNRNLTSFFFCFSFFFVQSFFILLFFFYIYYI